MLRTNTGTMRSFLLILSLACASLAMNAQNRRSILPRVSIDAVRVVPQIYVSVKLLADDKQLYVPYCAETEGGDPLLCTLGVHLQVHTDRGWSPVKLKTTSGLLGGARIGRAGGKLIPAGDVGSFTFQFSKKFYAVLHGQQLRLVIDTWRDEASMKNDQDRLELVSEPFVCP